MLIKNKKQAVLISVIFLCFFAMLAGIAAAYIRKFDNALEEENKGISQRLLLTSAQI